MECFHPLSIRNPKWLDGDTKAPRWIAVPCGKCAACLTNRRTELANRIQWEASSHINNIFFTLTYDEPNIPFQQVGEFVCPSVSKTDCQKFLKRLRQSLLRSGLSGKFRYILVSEYGPTTYRPHYHGIIFGFEYNSGIAHYHIQKAWQLGFVQADTLRDGGGNYVAKYILRPSSVPKFYPKNFALWSRRPALGSAHFTNNVVSNIRQRFEKSVVNPGGFKCKIPRCISSKIFSEDELQRLGEIGQSYRTKEFRDYLERFCQLGFDSAIDYYRENKSAKEIELNRKIFNITKKSKL